MERMEGDGLARAAKDSWTVVQRDKSKKREGHYATLYPLPYQA